MTAGDVRWITAFLDTAEERAEEAEVFWARVTGQVVSSRRGRREEFAKFARFRIPESRELIPDPSSATTFKRSKLNWASLNHDEHRGWREFYRGLLQARREKVAPLVLSKIEITSEYALLGQRAIRVSWNVGRATLTVVANLGPQPVPSAKQIPGANIFGVGYWGAAAAGEVPPYSAAWFLDE